MKTAINIARAELQNLFYSPVAWLILVIFTFQSSSNYMGSVEGWVQFFAQGYKLPGISMDLFANQSRGLYFHVLGNLYLYIPLLTMGLMSREFSSESIKLLYSSPVTNAQIIIGKFLSMMAYGLLLVAILLVPVLFSWYYVENFEIAAIMMGLLGVYLVICAYAAIGLFMSSLTSYQVVAAMGTFAILSLLNYVGGLWQDIEFVRDLTFWVAIGGRAIWFIFGMFCSEDFLYFIIVALLFLSLTILRLQNFRQRSSKLVIWGKYMGVVSAALLLGYISSRPSMMTYYDATNTKTNTLTVNSQNVIKQLKGGLTITTYTNILDDANLWIANPSAVNIDLARFKQYTRFKPEIKMEYVYYYDTIQNSTLDKRYPNMTDKERMEKIADLYKINKKLIKSPEEIRKMIDLSAEGNRFVRTIKRASGEQTFLRIFDDPSILPNEMEITAALKRVAMKLPIVGFIKGHGERDNSREGDRNYRRFAQDKPFRYALLNQGFDVADVYLNEEVDSSIHILLIGDMRHALTPIEKENLNKYIARGGNLFIAGEPKRQSIMDDFVAPFGVKFVDGILVHPSDNYLANFIVAKPTPWADSISYMFGDMARRKNVVTMPTSVGLTYEANPAFEITPLFVSDSSSWSEKETTDFIDDTARYNPELGEVQQSYATALAVSRKTDARTQKVIVLGDADCISNGEISISRKELPATNYSLLMGSFYWLSDNEVPIDVRRPPLTDGTIHLNEKSTALASYILIWGFSGILAITGLILWIRRRRR